MAHELIPENDTQELWTISAKVESLHDYIIDLAKKQAKSKYISEPLDDDMRMVCLIMGFHDALMIEKEVVAYDTAEGC